MTRTVNASFSGIPPFDVDVGAPALTNTLKETLEDINLIHDMITGEYSTPTDMCEHIGGGKGALLGVPICSQPIAATLQKMYFDGGIAADAYDEISHVILWSAPFYVPKGGGEITFCINIEGEELGAFFLTVLEDDATVFSQQAAFVTSGEAWSGTASVVFDNATEDNAWYICQITCSTPRNVSSGVQGGIRTTGITINDVNIFYNEPDGFSPLPLIQQDAANYTPVDAAGSGVAFVDNEVSDEMIAQNGRSINAKILTAISRNLSNLYEYVTGWPVPGNQTLTNADTGDIRPVTSRFLAHNQSEYASEPLIQWPIFCEGLGAVGVRNDIVSTDSPLVPLVDAALTDGSLSWFAPFPTSTSAASIRRLRFYMPNLPLSGTKLVLKVLIASNDSDKISNWQIGISLNGGATTYAGASYIDAITGLSMATFTGLAPTLDEENDIQMSFRRTAGAAENFGFMVLGWCMAYTY